jgi:hypothetical protein
MYIYKRKKKPIIFLNLLFHTQSQKLLGCETRTKHMALPGQSQKLLGCETRTKHMALPGNVELPA